MIYSSKENKLIREIKKLQEKKYRDKQNKFIIEGYHLVKEAINRNLVEYVIVDESIEFEYDNKIVVTDSIMKYLSSLNSCSNIMAVCKKQEGVIKGNRILVLDNIQDPGNLGTIIRSCVAFNVDTLIISKDSVDLYNSKVIRATQGMIFHLNIVIEDLKHILPTLKKNYNIIGTNVVSGKNIKEFKKKKKFVIIMGNEGKGINKDILKFVDDNIYISMNKSCESLNVGVAASIIMYELGEL